MQDCSKGSDMSDKWSVSLRQSVDRRPIKRQSHKIAPMNDEVGDELLIGARKMQHTSQALLDKVQSS